MNLREAIRYSCNTYFFQLAQRLGAKELVDTYYTFGLGRKTGIDLPGEKTGYLPLINYEQLRGGLLLQFAIGQGKIGVTPLELAVAFSAIANRGWLPRPHLLKKIVDENGLTMKEFKREGRFIKYERRDWEVVIEGMKEVVERQGGTAYEAGFPEEWEVAGKTGTAQKGGGRVDAWFVCFAPTSSPKILVLVLVEDAEGGGGKVSAPLAKKILKFYFDGVKN